MSPYSPPRSPQLFACPMHGWHMLACSWQSWNGSSCPEQLFFLSQTGLLTHLCVGRCSVILHQWNPVWGRSSAVSVSGEWSSALEVLWFTGFHCDLQGFHLLLGPCFNYIFIGMAINECRARLTDSFVALGPIRVGDDLASSHDSVCSGLDSKGQRETNGILLAGYHVTHG